MSRWRLSRLHTLNAGSLRRRGAPTGNGSSMSMGLFACPRCLRRMPARFAMACNSLFAIVCWAMRSCLTQDTKQRWFRRACMQITRSPAACLRQCLAKAKSMRRFQPLSRRERSRNWILLMWSKPLSRRLRHGLRGSAGCVANICSKRRRQRIVVTACRRRALTQPMRIHGMVFRNSCSTTL